MYESNLLTRGRLLLEQLWLLLWLLLLLLWPPIDDSYRRKPWKL
jgi:hypothetical protein